MTTDYVTLTPIELGASSPTVLLIPPVPTRLPNTAGTPGVYKARAQEERERERERRGKGIKVL